MRDTFRRAPETGQERAVLEQDARRLAETDPQVLGVDFSNTYDVWIGDFSAMYSGTAYQFVGDIDAVRISSGALTPSEFIQPIPEPSSVVLLAGLCGVGLVLLRRRQR